MNRDAHGCWSGAALNFGELRKGEVRILGLLRSSLPENSHLADASPLVSMHTYRRYQHRQGRLVSPTLWEECASSVAEKASGPVRGIGEV